MSEDGVNRMSEWAGADEPLPEALRKAVNDLPRERMPGELLEERTVRAARAAGVLGSASGAVSDSRRAGVPAAWKAAGIAAALALFAGGVVTGQWLGGRQTAEVLAAQQQATMQEMAALVEQTGSAYVSALASLAESNAVEGAETTDAHEAALQILHQAANEVVRMAPNDPVAAKILQGFDHAALQQAPQDPNERRRQIVWF